MSVHPGNMKGFGERKLQYSQIIIQKYYANCHILKTMQVYRRDQKNQTFYFYRTCSSLKQIQYFKYKIWIVDQRDSESMSEIKAGGDILVLG